MAISQQYSQQKVQDTGSNYNFGDKLIKASPKRSVFDVSYKNDFSCKLGYIYPCYTQFTLPTEDYSISLSQMIRVINTPKVPLNSRQRALFQYRWTNFNRLWKYANVWISKGRSGTVSGFQPMIWYYGKASEARTKFGRGTLFDFLLGSLPQNVLRAADDEYVEFTFPALPFMMYQRDYRDVYMNQNLNPDNGEHLNSWFPFDDSDFRLIGKPGMLYTLSGIAFSPSDETLAYFRQGIAAGVSYFEFFKVFWDNPAQSAVGYYGLEIPNWSVDLTVLRYGNFADDYFTTARTSPQRGEQPTLPFDFSGSGLLPVGVNVNSEFKPAYLYGRQSNTAGGALSLTSFFSDLDGNRAVRVGQISTRSELSPVDEGFVAAFQSWDTSSPILADGSSFSGSGSVTAANLRELFSASIIGEKLARTDGSYKEFLKTFFGRSSRDAEDFHSLYIGSEYQPIVYAEVLQTSPSEGQDLGHIGAKGISASDGRIGHLYSDDFGIILGYMRIVPDTYYSTTRYKPFWYETQEDLPLPERTELGMKPILNKELLWTGNETVDNDVYGYQDIFDELRYRPNEVHGAYADPSQMDFYAYTQVRELGITPTLSQSFVAMSPANINNNYLSMPDEDVFGVQVLSHVRLVSPLPYKAIPSGLGV